MTIEHKKGDKGEPNKPFLLIQLNNDNSIQVNGVISNKLLAYSMLESARDAIKDHIDNLNKQHAQKIATNGKIVEDLSKVNLKREGK